MIRYLGIDYGAKRIGLAVGDDGARLASPVATIEPSGGAQMRAEAIARVARQYGADALVVGLPRNMDGTEGPQSRRTRRFAQVLGRVSGLPVYFQDERLTSYAAEELLGPTELTRKKQRRRRDAVAAQIILQGFLDQSRGP